MKELNICKRYFFLEIKDSYFIQTVFIWMTCQALFIRRKKKKKKKKKPTHTLTSDSVFFGCMLNCFGMFNTNDINHFVPELGHNDRAYDRNDNLPKR